MTISNGSTVNFPHDDPIPTIAGIVNWDVKRVFYDDRSKVDVLFICILPKLGVLVEALKPMVSPTYGVGPNELPVLSVIKLPFIAKGRGVWSSEELYVLVMENFIIVDVSSPYNTIVKSQTQGMLHMRANVKYPTMTFEVDKCEAVIFIDQAEV